MDSTALFSKTPPLKLFFTAAVPGAISMLASSLYQLIDGILVGNFLDSTSFAALNLAMPFVIINFALSDLVGVGSSVPISVALGRGDRKEANNVFTCACLLILGAGVLMGTIMFTAAPFLIGMMGAEGDFAALAVQYLRTYALCSPFTTILYAADNYLRASLGMFICVVLSFIPFVRGKALLRFVRPRFELRTLRQIVTCGCPTFLNNIAGRITSILMNLFLVRLGGELAVSVYGVLMYVDGFIQPLLYGMCDSLQPAVGYNWGARQFSRVRAIERCCFAAAGVVSLASVFALALLPEPITRLFMAGAEGETLAMAAGALRLADDKKRALQQRLQAARNSGVFRGKPDLLMGKRRGMEQRAVGFRTRAAGALHGDTAELVFHLGRKGHIRSPFFVLSVVICGNRGAW